MTSVPLGFWPNNLSTLFTVGFLLAFFATGFDLISTEMAANITLAMIIGIVLDQLVLGPIWFFWTKRQS